MVPKQHYRDTSSGKLFSFSTARDPNQGQENSMTLELFPIVVCILRTSQVFLTLKVDNIILYNGLIRLND